jgi:hypothetical protein
MPLPVGLKGFFVPPVGVEPTKLLILSQATFPVCPRRHYIFKNQQRTYMPGFSHPHLQPLLHAGNGQKAKSPWKYFQGLFAF